MKFPACFIIFGTFVNIESLHPRSVNVALETVLEFDGKHGYRDVKAIDKLQNYLGRIKTILGENDASRRHLKEGFKFRDFLKICLQTLMTYDDNDLLDVIALANNEIRKYHYKGCKFYELVENQNLRRDMADKLVNLNELTAKELRTELSKAVNAVESDVMSEKKKKMLDYLDSVYVGGEIKGKMQQFLAELEQFKQRSKRASLNLVKVVQYGLRSILFDHFSNLNANARKELKDLLETMWLDFKNIKEERLDPKTEKTYTVSVKNTINQGLWKVVPTKSNDNLKIVYPKEPLAKVRKPKERKRNKKNIKHLEPTYATETKKYKQTTPEKDSSSTEVTIRHIYTQRRPHQDVSWKKPKEKRVRSKTTPIAESSDEHSLTLEMDSRFINVRDSLEIFKKRSMNKGKRKRRQRKRKNAGSAIKVYLGKHKQGNMESDESSDSQRYTQVMRKSNLADNFTSTISNFSTDQMTPGVINSINRIEKVLDEIKDIVKNVTLDKHVNKTVTIQDFINVNVSTKNRRRVENVDGEKTVLYGRKALIKEEDKSLEELENVSSQTKKTMKINERKTSNKQTTKVSSHVTKSTDQESTKSILTKSVYDDDTIIIKRKHTNINKDTEKDTTVSNIIKNKSTTKHNFETTKSTATLSIHLKVNDTQSKDKKENLTDNIQSAEEDKLRREDKELEKMLNETRRAGVDNVIGRHADENKDLNEKINKKIEGHMERLFSMTRKAGNSSKPFDFNIDDPFDFKDTKEALHDDTVFK